MDKRQSISDLLGAIEIKMQQSGLWSHSPPTEEAMVSQVPFACDSMGFEQWIQFIFLPKMADLIKLGLPLPENLCLSPMIEESAKTTPGIRVLQPLLNQLDHLFANDGKGSC